MLVVAIGAVYYAWRGYNSSRTKRQEKLRKRVAYMLWVMAQDNEEETLTNAEAS